MRVSLPIALVVAGVSTSTAQTPGLTYNFTELAQGQPVPNQVMASNAQPITLTIVVQPPQAVNSPNADVYGPQDDTETGEDQGTEPQAAVNGQPQGTPADNQPQGDPAAQPAPNPANPAQPAVNYQLLPGSPVYTPPPFVSPQYDPDLAPQQPYTPYWPSAPYPQPQVLGDSPVAAQPLPGQPQPPPQPGQPQPQPGQPQPQPGQPQPQPGQPQPQPGQPQSQPGQPQPQPGQPQPQPGQPQPRPGQPEPQPANGQAQPAATPTVTPTQANTPPPSQPPSGPPATPQPTPSVTPVATQPAAA